MLRNLKNFSFLSQVLNGKMYVFAMLGSEMVPDRVLELIKLLKID